MFVVSNDERVELVRLTKRFLVCCDALCCARIVLASVEVSSNTEVNVSLRDTAATVGMGLRRFSKSRVKVLCDERRVGAPRKVSAEAVDAVIVKTLERVPKSHTRTHWSTCAIAKSVGISHSDVQAPCPSI